MNEELRVGRYILVRKIGEGGMAEVWEGRHYLLDTRTAVKFLLPEFARNKELQERFLNEGKRQAQLQHPNIVPALDFFQIDGRSYLVMRYVEGESLESRLEKHRPPLTMAEIQTISWDVSSALDYAHSLGVVHRDVKPANMLIDRGGNTLLMDFGIAKALREERSVTLTGTSMGTPDYMSPEQIVDPKRVDSRSDVYSFGCVLYAMFTGETPFSYEGATAFHVQTGHVRSVPPPLVYRNPDVPHSFGDVVLKCLEKDPADRYPTCGAVMSALEQLLSEKRPMPPQAAVLISSQDQKNESLPPGDGYSSHASKATVVDQKPARSVTQAVTQPYRSSQPHPASTPEAASMRASTVFIAPKSPPSDQGAAVPAKVAGKAGKYFVLVSVFVMLMAGAGYFLLHAKTHGQDSSDRLQQLRSKDWPHARYDDPDFSDCLGVQACLDSRDVAARLKNISNWKSLRYDDPLLKQCMGFPQCTEQAEHATALMKTTDWARADKTLLADCMSYAPCTESSSRHAAGTRPEAASVPRPAAIKGSRSVEDLPSCCSKDSNPRQCVALKKQADLADCSSPIGDN